MLPQIYGLLPLATAAAVVLVGLADIFYRNDKAAAYAVGALFAALSAEGVIFLEFATSPLRLGLMYITPFTSFFMMLFGAALLMVTLLSSSHPDKFGRFAMLSGFISAGIILIISGTSLIELILALELISISTSFLILSGGKKRVEAATKFFILGGLSVSIFTFAMALILQGNPSLSIAPMQPGLLTGIALLVSILFAVALSFEASLFPFNLWVPDVYEGSSTDVTALLAGVNKKVAFVVIFEVFFVMLSAYRSEFSGIFALLSIITMFFGNIIALVQDNVKRMFAYSAISQAGYITIGLAVGTAFGLESSIFQIFAHTFMIIGAFAIVAMLESDNIKTYREYSGLFYRNKFAAVSLSLIMLSMAGIPPLIGFDGKLFLFSSAVSSGMVYLAVIGIINSLISIYYYIRLMGFMFTEKEARKLNMSRTTLAVVIISLFSVVALGIYPTPVLHYAALASSFL